MRVKVEFKMFKLGFAVVFYRPEESISDGNIGGSIGDSVGVNETQRQIIAKMSKNSKINAKAIAAEIGIVSRNFEANIKSIKKQGSLSVLALPKTGIGL